MATLLKKDVTRESKVVKDGREIYVTLTEDQNIEMRPKNSRDEPLSISISELYDMLNGDKPVEQKETKPEKVDKPKEGGDYVSLSKLRTQNAIANMDYETKAKFDKIIIDLMD